MKCTFLAKRSSFAMINVALAFFLAAASCGLGHRKRLREALGNTLSDEFVDVILGKLVEALRPGLYDHVGLHRPACAGAAKPHGTAGAHPDWLCR